MTRIAYVQGQFIPQAEARVAMEDRGYQFADGVYEVAAYLNGRMLDETRHLDRLERSLSALNIPMPMHRVALHVLWCELIRRNGRRDGLVYVQVTRGVAPRNHVASTELKPVLTMGVLPVRIASSEQRAKGVGAITAPDLRHARCDIKSTALLANVMARQLSYDQGQRETFLYHTDGIITEGSATNVFIVDAKGVLRTHPTTHAILPGITREVVIGLAKANSMQVEERAFTREEMAHAHEIFFTSTSAFIMPVTALDGAVIGNGKPGAITMKLQALYEAHVAKETA